MTYFRDFTFHSDKLAVSRAGEVTNPENVPLKREVRDIAETKVDYSDPEVIEKFRRLAAAIEWVCNTIDMEDKLDT